MDTALYKLPKDHFLFTSESVAAGHPDKLCDFISDSVLDAFLAQDPNAKVACETAVKNNICMVFGEVKSTAKVNIEQVTREAIKEVGYTDVEVGMDYRIATIIVAIDQQSTEIFNAVENNLKDEDIGAGDQGLMIGYATNETVELHPISHLFANQLCARLRHCKDNKIIPWLRPDAKTQVTVEYKKVGDALEVIRVHTVLFSVQHDRGITQEQIATALMEECVKNVIPQKYLDDKTIYHFNPSGSFIVGGPTGDAGLTGRKIIVDSYGGWGGHGGGAFSGKDATKVDRSGAYAVRWVAKSLVAAGFCNRVMVEIAYGIGIANPISIFVNSYGTVQKGFNDYDLQDIVIRNFDLRPGMIIKNLDLKRPVYKQTASFGHFGRQPNNGCFSWEEVKDLSHEARKQ